MVSPSTDCNRRGSNAGLLSNSHPGTFSGSRGPHREHAGASLNHRIVEWSPLTPSMMACLIPAAGEGMEELVWPCDWITLVMAGLTALSRRRPAARRGGTGRWPGCGRRSDPETGKTVIWFLFVEKRRHLRRCPRESVSAGRGRRSRSPTVCLKCRDDRQRAPPCSACQLSGT